ncbi:MAG: hypothetical protein KME27_22620 [Lyngbya sp. HA4199-MV5]|nr:hypothetical protein [Lyngbya sp. HA4199-MV5]
MPNSLNNQHSEYNWQLLFFQVFSIASPDATTTRDRTDNQRSYPPGWSGLSKAHECNRSASTANDYRSQQM